MTARGRWWPALVALAVLVALLLAVRGATLVSPGMQNPDEAELLAEGLRAALDLVPYSLYTSSTHLFLWPFSLGVLAKLGVPMTLATAHVLTGASYVWIAFMGWIVIARSFGWVRAGLLVVPTAVVVFAGVGDFLSLGSELFPVCVLMLAAAVLLWPDARPGRVRLVVVSALAGSAVWFKPQVLLLSLTVVALAVLMQALPVAGERRREPRVLLADAATAAASFVVPSAVFVAVMAVAGTLPAFIQEPVLFQWSYLTARVALGGESPGVVDRVGGTATFVLAYPLTAAWALAGFVGWSSMPLGGRRRKALVSLVWAVPLVAVFATLLAGFPIFPHYANLLFAGTLIAGMVGSTVRRRLAPGDARPATLGLPAALAYSGFAALLGLSLLPTMALGVQSLRTVQDQPAPTAAALAAQKALDTLCPAGSKVLVWGWASELYAAYDWTPASRYVNAWPRAKTPQQDYYRATLVDELKADPPQCVVDAANEQFFGGTQPATDAINVVVPAMTTVLRPCYERLAVALPDGRGVDLWHRTPGC